MVVRYDKFILTLVILFKAEQQKFAFAD